MKFLLLSAGRRVELAKYLRNALKEENSKNELITADLTHNAPACYFGDKYIAVPRVTTQEYIVEIVKICNEEKIDLIIPTIDTELQILADNRHYIEKETMAKVLISDSDFIKIANDKRISYKWFIENGFKSPRILSESELEMKKYELPLFIKPLNGSSSINAFKVNNERELSFFREYINEPIVQDFILGEEYTIDVMSDFEGNIVSIVPRLRIATRSGEISKGRIIKDRELIEEVKKVCDKAKIRGPITLQCIKNNEGIYFIEINARFGGGAPMGFAMGANSAKTLVSLVKGDIIEYNEDYKDNILALRFDDTIFVDEITNEKI